jgi:hypothetical protein
LSLHVTDPQRTLVLAGADGTADTSGDVTRMVLSRTVGTDLPQEEAVRLSKTVPRVRFLPDEHSVEVSWDGPWEKLDLLAAEAPPASPPAEISAPNGAAEAPAK